MQQSAKEIRPPSWLLAFSDGPRALAEIASLPLYTRWLRRMPRGDSHPVMVIPGFMGDDSYNEFLLRYLKDLGYVAIGWGQGRNLGVASLDVDEAIQHLELLSGSSKLGLSLIGHSLGGIYARELARLRPELVRQVISLGSPFGEGRDTGSHVSRLYQALNPKAVTEDSSELALAPPVPTTAVYSRGDGVVHWRTSLQSDGHDKTENVEVCGSHTGLTLNPAVWFLLAERLAQRVGQWRHFERSGWRRLVFPKAAWPSASAHP